MKNCVKFEVSNRTHNVGRDLHTLFSPDDLGSREFKKLNFLLLCNWTVGQRLPITCLQQVFFNMSNRKTTCLKGKHSTYKQASTARNPVTPSIFNQKEVRNGQN